MFKNSFYWVGLKKSSCFQFIICILLLTFISNSNAKEFSPQEKFNMSNDWKILSYGLEDKTEKMIVDAKLAFKDSVNGVMLQLEVSTTCFDTTLLNITKTKNSGYNWDSLITIKLPGKGTFLDIEYHNNTIIFLSAELRDYPIESAGKTNLWISNDDGKTWKFKVLDYYEDGTNFDRHQTKIVVMNDSTYFILFRRYLIRSTNYGNDWSNLNSSIPWKSTLDYHRIVDIEKNNQVLYLLTEDNNSYIKYSSNLGNSWEAINATNYLTKTTNDLIVENQTNFMVIGGDWDEKIQSWHDSVFVTSNSGSTWSVLDTSLIPTHHKGIYCENNGFLIYNSPQYVYHFADIKKENRNIGGDKFDDALFFFYDDAEYIGNNKVVLVDIFNGNVWLYTFPSSSVSESSEPFSISLSPNPAGDFITVTLKPSEGFEPSEGSEIQIYNTLGEKVMSVGSDRDLSVRINISALLKGMYFIRIGSEIAKFIKM